MTIRTTLVSIALVTSTMAACGKSESADKAPPKPVEAAEPAPPPAPPAPAPPALVDLELDAGGDLWKGLVVKAPAGSKVRIAGHTSVFVRGPDGSGWGISLLEADALDTMKAKHKADPTFKAAEVDETDRYIGTRTSTSGQTSYRVLVRSKVGDKTYTCEDSTMINERAFADSYAEACASLRKKS